MYWAVNLVVGVSLPAMPYACEYEETFKTEYDRETGEPKKRLEHRKPGIFTVNEKNMLDWDDFSDYLSISAEQVLKSRWESNVFLTHEGGDEGLRGTYLGVRVARVREHDGHSPQAIKTLGDDKEAAIKFLEENFGYKGPVGLYLITTYS